MAFPPEPIAPDAFSRTDVQDMLDDAQIDAAYLYTNIPHLRDQLQHLLWEAIEECNSRHVDPMELLHCTMITERTILDAHNKHRLGNAVTPFNARVLEPETAVEYRAEENIPEMLDWFPLRATVSKRGVYVKALPIYQVGQTTEADQVHTMERSSSETLPPCNRIQQKTVNSESTTTWKSSTCYVSLKYNKLRDAPSPWLPFPSGNLTMAEVTAFLPQAIKSFDIIDRFVYNGALAMTLASMINHYRVMPGGPIENNTIYRMMKGQMNIRAKADPTYKGWTVTKHADIKKPTNFNPSSVSVTNFHTPENLNPSGSSSSSPQSAQTILFRDMAIGVKTMPSGPDALDLTRCIQYSIEHEDEDWYYPTDFTNLVLHLGGAAPIHYQHTDAAAIARHAAGLKLKNMKRVVRERTNHARSVNRKKAAVVEESVGYKSPSSSSSSSSDGDGDSIEKAIPPPSSTPTKRKNPTPSSPPSAKRYRGTVTTRSQARKPVVREETESESEENDLYVAPKTRGKMRVAARSSVRTRRFGRERRTY